MNKSNQEIWDETRGFRSMFSDWGVALQEQINDFAEAMKDYQRQVDINTYLGACSSAGFNPTESVLIALGNAGKEPELKPGMLVKSKSGNKLGVALEIQESDARIHDGTAWIVGAVPLTKAEIKVYMDKAPE